MFGSRRHSFGLATALSLAFLSFVLAPVAASASPALIFGHALDGDPRLLASGSEVDTASSAPAMRRAGMPSPERSSATAVLASLNVPTAVPLVGLAAPSSLRC